MFRKLHLDSNGLCKEYFDPKKGATYLHTLKLTDKDFAIDVVKFYKTFSLEGLF